MSAKQLSNDPINDAASGVVKWVDLTEINADQVNNSKKFPPDPKYLKHLAKDLQVRGQLMPMLVRETGDAPAGGFAAFPTYQAGLNALPNGGCPYTLIDGFTRYEALGIANGEGAALQAFIRVMPDMDSVKAYLTSIAANNPALRKEPTLMDMAYQILELRDNKGMTLRDIAGEIGMSLTWVSEAVKLTALRPDIQKRIHAKEIPWSVARVLPGLEEAEQDKTLGRLEKAKETGEGAKSIGEDVRAERGRGRTDGRGKKKGKRTGGQVVTISAKAALNAFEKLAADPEVDQETGKAAKETKAEETRRLVFAVLYKFIAGKVGQQAMVNQISKLL